MNGANVVSQVSEVDAAKVANQSSGRVAGNAGLASDARTPVAAAAPVAHHVAVVEFGAVWCPPCRVLLPLLDELSDEYGGAVKFAKVDCDESPDLASSFGVMSMPTVVFFRDGVPENKLVGLRPKQAYREIIDRLARA
ncbi:thioredoxin family protein [Cohnella fermenti]|uniref:Thioredoxin family protein n=2 Tax=Cohnella fermenti TaxID=2565925 RepID=A0A4S4CB64_9BACL|nr:thioredoxin family protein [Cohnella fermenti]